MNDDEKRVRAEQEVTRRHALSVLAGASAAFVWSCGASTVDDDDAAAKTDAGATTDAGDDAASGEGGADTCKVTPEGEIGPYFADDSASGFHRSDITTNIDGSDAQEGIALTLTITVVDAKKSCAPYEDAQIDIWHCNAAGIYSDIAAEETSSESYLRGYQITDADGRVTFKTIIPGWYSGRTTHIHLRVRSTYSDVSSTSDGANTTQVFFAQTFIDRLATSVAPYESEGTNPTTNASDRVYSQEVDGATLLTLAGTDASGYAASITIGLPITADYDASGMGTMGGEGGPMGLGEGGPPGLGEGGPSHEGDAG